MNSPRLNWPSRLPRLLWFRRQCPLGTSIEFEVAELVPFDRPLGPTRSLSVSLRQLLATILLVCKEQQSYVMKR